MTSGVNVLTHQPIAGQEVRCTCGAEDDLEGDPDLSPLSSSSPAAHVSVDRDVRVTADAPVIQAEHHLNPPAAERPITSVQDQTNHHLGMPQSAGDSEIVSPKIQLKYKDARGQPKWAEPVSRKKRQGTEARTPFVPGFQTLGRNYNMPEYLIKWQAEQFERSERARRRELAEEGKLNGNGEVPPIYLDAHPTRVPAPQVRSKSTQHRPKTDVGEETHAAVDQEPQNNEAAREEEPDFTASTKSDQVISL